MKKIGYARASKKNEEGRICLRLQCERLLEAGCDRFFCDMRAGHSSVMPGRIKMFESLKGEEIIMMTEVERITRSAKQAYDILELFSRKRCVLSCLDGTIFDPSENEYPIGIHFKFLVGEIEHQIFSKRMQANPKTTKASCLPLEEIKIAYKTSGNLGEVFESPRFRPFKGSLRRVSYLLQEDGLMPAKIAIPAQKMMKEFNSLAARRRKIATPSAPYGLDNRSDRDG